MNRFAKMKKERIYTLLGTLSIFSKLVRGYFLGYSVSNVIGILESEVVKWIKENIL